MKNKVHDSAISSVYKVIYTQRLSFILLVFIIFTAIFFRFYNTPLRFSLGEDSTRDAMVAFQGAQDLQLPLTGPFSSLGPFTFGPWYYYQIIIFTAITHFSYAPWIYLALMSVFFVFIMYKIGELMINKYFGLVVASLVAISPSQISTAVTLGNPNLISLYAGLTVLLSFIVINRKRSLWWNFFLGVVLGIGINLHYQMSGLFILPLILFILRPKRYIAFICTIVGVAVTFLPLLFFDLNNHWYTLRNMYYYFTVGKYLIYVPNRWLFYLRDFWPSFLGYVLGVSRFIAIILIGGFGGITSWLFLKRKITKEMVFLLGGFGVNFVLLRYYWGERGYGYLQYLYPFLYIFIGFFIWKIITFNKYAGLLVFSILVAIILPRSFKELDPGDFNKEMYRETNLLLKDYPGRSFVLYNCKSKYKVRVQALAVILQIQGKLNPEGVKIGLGDIGLDACRYPGVPGTYDKDLEVDIAAGLFTKVYPRSKLLGVFDFSVATEEARLQSGWSPITQKVVYDSTVRWWFKEQP